MKVVAFVPIKLNNQRLPGKNLMDLNGRPLCDYIFQTINKIDEIDEKYVYCSDDSIQQYIPEGITYLKRNVSLDTPETKGTDIIRSFLIDVYADIYVLTHVTEPFTRTASIREALEKVVSGNHDSAFSAEEVRNYCWYKGKPVNYDMDNLVTTQNLEPIYVETGSFFIFRRDVFEKTGRRIGETPYMHTTGRLESIDIDTADDFAFAEVTARYLAKRDR